MPCVDRRQLLKQHLPLTASLLMAGVLTASRMLGWRGYKVGKLLKSWKAQAPTGVSAAADAAG